MPKNLFSIEVKTEQQLVASFIRLNTVALTGFNFKAGYSNTIVLPDSSELEISRVSVDRSVDDVQSKGDSIDYNGNRIMLADLILMTAQFAEKWRTEDIDNRTRDAANAVAAAQAASIEAARWAALDDKQKQAEIDAAALANPVFLDPTPNGK